MSEPLEVPKPVLGAAYEPVLQFKVAVFGQFCKLQVMGNSQYSKC